MKVVNITFTVLSALHSLLIVLIMADIVIVEYVLHDEVGLGGFLSRLTMLLVWLSLLAISVIYFLMTRWRKPANQRLMEVNWLVARIGVMLGAWFVLPFLTGVG